MLKKIILVALFATFSFGICSYTIDKQYKSLVLIGYAYEDKNILLANIYYQDYLFWSAQVIAECGHHPEMVEQTIQTRKDMSNTFKEINNGK